MRTYGWGGDEYVAPGDMGYALAQCYDSGFVVGGCGFPVWPNRALSVVRTDPYGDKLWDYSCCPSLRCNGCAFSVQATADSGFIATGWLEDDDTRGRDLVFVHKSRLIHLGWIACCGGAGFDAGYSVLQAPGGSYVAVGELDGGDSRHSDILVAGCSAEGDSVWMKSYGGTGTDVGYSICPVIGDDGYMACGVTSSEDCFGLGVILLRLAANGDTLWTKTYATPTCWASCSMAQTRDGGYVIAGTEYPYVPPALSCYSGSHIVILKVDVGGDMVWSRQYGGTGDDWARDIQQTSDGGFVVVGRTDSRGAGQDDVYLLRLDQNGDTLWTGTYGGEDFDEGTKVRQGMDGCYIIAGTTSSYGGGASDMLLIKTLPDPTLGLPWPTRLSVSPGWPNPSAGSAAFAMELSRPADVSLSLFDVAGRLLGAQLSRPGGVGHWEWDVDLKDLSRRALVPGVYFCHFRAGESSVTRKVVYTGNRGDSAIR